MTATAVRHALREITVRAGDPGATPIVDGVSFDVAPGTLVGIVGETGAGKTVMTRACLGLLPQGLTASGTVALAGGEPLPLDRPELVRAGLGSSLSCVLQNPLDMLDPLQRVGRQLCEGVVRTGAMTAPEARERALSLLRRMGFPDPEQILPLYPHQLSGGMAQRVATALGMMPGPQLLVLDEPTSALDAHVRLEVLGLLRAMAEQEGTAILLISHDLASVDRFCDEIVVLYAGIVAERGTAGRVVARPRHPYTRALTRCTTSTTAARRELLPAIAGTPVVAGRRPGGCPFAPRCALAIARCRSERPALETVDGRAVACHRADETVALPAPARSHEQAPPLAPSPAGDGGTPPAVRVHEVQVDYRRRGERFTALDGVSLELERGRTLAVVGESGAGKSTLVKVVAGFERPRSGTVEIGGQPPKPRAGRVSPVQVVFQHPALALNPYRSIGDSVALPLRRLRREARAARVRELLQSVGLDPERAGAKPGAFSGGQLQRVVLARALAADPLVLVCDEATSALDVSVQAQIANLILRLQAERGFACLCVTHDLGLARVLADDVLVLRDGRCVERAAADAFFAGPRSEYARSLLAATAGETVAPPVGAGAER